MEALSKNPCDRLKLFNLDNKFDLTDSNLDAAQKWNLQKSACNNEVKIELGPVLAQFRANLSFAAPKMLLSGR